jgi:competence protein ComEC
MKKFAPLPKFIFVWITIGLSLGIALEISGIDIDLYLSALFIVSASLALYFIHGRFVHIQQLFIIFLFASLGYTLSNSRNNNSLNYSLENKLYIAEVIESGTFKKAWNKVIIETKWIVQNGLKTAHSERILVYLQNEGLSFYGGTELLIKGEINPIKNKNNPGEFDAETYWLSKGIRRMAFLTEEQIHLLPQTSAASILNSKKLNHRLGQQFDQHLPNEEAALARALILGDKSNLDHETIQAFGNAGAMHVLAVSGLHVGLIMQLLLYLFGRFPKYISKYKALWLTFALMVFYAFLTGFSSSVCRAVWMFGLLAYAQTSDRSHNKINLLFASAFILLIWNPLNLLDIGFQLSYAAMIGILTLYRPIEKCIFFKSKVLQKAWQGTAVGIAATILTLPLTSYYFHQFPNYFILSNLGVMLAAEVILVSGIALLSLFWVPIINLCIAFCLGWSIFGLIYFVKWIDRLPYAVAKGLFFNLPEVFAFYSLILLVVLLLKSSKKYKLVLTSVLVIGMMFYISYKRHLNINKKELIVFSSNHNSFLLKNRNKLLCFYESEEKLSKIQRDVLAYEKVYPGQISYHQLSDKQELKIKLKDELLRVVPSKYHYQISTSKTEVALYRKSAYTKKLPSVETLVLKPYDHNHNLPNSFHLDQGPFRLAFD